MAGPSIASEFFRQIIESTDAVAMFRGMIGSDPPTVETEYFDCKGGADKDGPLKDREINKTWSEAVSGFATTGGGVIVFGLDARKPKDSTIDEVCGVNLVTDPHAVKSRLHGITSAATDPPVLGTRVEAYDDPSEPGKGFVVGYVPESPYKPHQQLIGGKKWMIRAGTSFIDASPAILRSLFFPHRNSYIYMRITREFENDGGFATSGVLRASFEIRLINEGPATAHDLAVKVPVMDGMKYATGVPWVQMANRDIHFFRREAPLHPGETSVMATGVIMLPVLPTEANRLSCLSADVEFRFSLYATDQGPMYIEVPCKFEGMSGTNQWVAQPKPLEIPRFPQ